MAQDMDWDDLANMWWKQFEHMETDPNSRARIKRGRSRSRTPSARKRADRAPSRAKGMQPRKLTFSSARTRSRSRSASVPRKKSTWGKAAYFEARKNLPHKVVERMWRKTAQGKRNQSTLDKISKLSKVRHKLTRKDARKTMPRGKPYSRRVMKKPKGAYRGAVMPKWAKGETKHILINDNCTDVNPITLASVTSSPYDNEGVMSSIDIGNIKSWSLNPMKQGTGATDRNGRSVDGTYLRIQGHIHNTSASVKSYVRFLVLAVKGGSAGSTNNNNEPTAKFLDQQLFKKINGDIFGFDKNDDDESGENRVRAMQLPVNKQLFTVLSDQKFQLADTGESFGSSDRLFDLKMKLKQRSTWSAGDDYASFEKNQLVFAVITADPTCNKTQTSGAIKIEFESKYSFKDF